MNWDTTLMHEMDMRPWSYRLGLLAGWVMTGVMAGMAGDGALIAHSLTAASGWMAFEVALAIDAPILYASMDGASAVSHVMRLNMAAMAVVMMTATSFSGCNPLAGESCFQRTDTQYALSWRSGMSRIMTRVADLLGEALWKRFQGDRPRTWNILLAPVVHDSKWTGGGVGIQLAL